MNTLDSASEGGPTPSPTKKELIGLEDMPELDVFGNVEPEPLSKKQSRVKSSEKKVVYESDGETAEKYGSLPSIRQSSLHHIVSDNDGHHQHGVDLSAFRSEKSQKQQVHD